MLSHTSEETPITRQVMIEMYIEGWRFARGYLRVLQKLELAEQQKFLGQYRYYMKQITDVMLSHGLKVVNLEGELFDPGFPITVLNLADYENKSPLFIDQMIEPVVMGNEGVIRMGTALVKQGGI